MKPPINKPAIMPRPLADSADSALKKPPMLQPNESIAPQPMSKPPPAPLIISFSGAERSANSR